MTDKSKVKVDLPEGVERAPTKPGGPHTNDDDGSGGTSPTPPAPPKSPPKNP